jgi:hypothetical protein
MKTKIFLVLAALSTLIIVSCKKSSSSSQSNSLIGKWFFESEHVTTQSNTAYTSGGINYQTVSVSDYTTTYDSGTVNITSNTMTTAGLTYYISSRVFATDYENGVVVDTTSAPFTYYVAPASAATTYTMIGTDSVYFPTGGFTSTPGSSGGAGGAKIAIVGDSVLTLSTAYSKDSTGFLYGMPVTITNQANLVTTLHR